MQKDRAGRDRRAGAVYEQFLHQPVLLYLLAGYPEGIQESCHVEGRLYRKGNLATTPYLVVQRSDGTEQQCNFKIEAEVDEVLEEIHKRHPEIPVYSAESEKKLRKAKAEQEARYLKKLPEDAAAVVRELEKAKAYLQQDERYSKLIVFAAKQKRSLDGTKTSLKTWLL